MLWLHILMKFCILRTECWIFWIEIVLQTLLYLCSLSAKVMAIGTRFVVGCFELCLRVRWLFMFQTDRWWPCSLSWNSGQKQCGVWGCRISSCCVCLLRFQCFQCFISQFELWIFGPQTTGKYFDSVPRSVGVLKKTPGDFQLKLCRDSGDNFSDKIISPLFFYFRKHGFPKTVESCQSCTQTCQTLTLFRCAFGECALT